MSKTRNVIAMEAEYRKFRSGKEFMKLQDGSLVSVMNMKSVVRILKTNNKYLLHDFRDESLTVESNKDEFSKAMSEAKLQISD